MWKYNYTPDPDRLVHYGVKGMRWGYTDGRPNGGQTAENPGAGPAGGGEVEEDEEESLLEKAGNAIGSLFDTKITTTRPSYTNPGKKEVIVRTEKGEISKAIDRGKKAVNDAINKAGNAIDSLFDTKITTTRPSYTNPGEKEVTVRTEKGKISKAVDKGKALFEKIKRRF